MNLFHGMYNLGKKTIILFKYHYDFMLLFIFKVLI